MTRRAFTLFELLIVLAVIVMIMGIAMPSVSRMNTRSRLSSAAREFQADLNRARLIAMESGEAHVFHFLPGTGHYEIIPKKDYDRLFPRRKVPETLDSRKSSRDLQKSSSPGPQTAPGYGAGSSIASLGDLGKPTTTGNLKPATMGDLGKPATLGDIAPDGPPTWGTTLVNIAAQSSVDPQKIIRNELPENITFLAAGQPGLSSGQSGGQLGGQSGGWSAPIYFFPNGRTSNAELAVMISSSPPYCIPVSLRGLTGTASVGKLEVMP